MRIVAVVCLTALLVPAAAAAQRSQLVPAEWREAQGWRTDWSNYIVHPDSLTLLGDRKSIPSLDNPKFETIESAGRWLNDREPVAVVSINGDVRA